MPAKLFDCLAISSPSFSLHPQLVSEAKVLAKKIVINSSGVKFDATSLAKFLNEAKADAAIIGTDPLTSSAVSSLQYLKAIGKYGVGCDNIDLVAVKEKGIHFGWEGGVNRRSVSELVLGFMLGHQRNIFRSVDRMPVLTVTSSSTFTNRLAPCSARRWSSMSSGKRCSIILDTLTDI